MSSDKYLTPSQALDLALEVSGTYNPPKCHRVWSDRNNEPGIMPTWACPHTDDQILSEWRVAVAAAGVIL